MQSHLPCEFDLWFDLKTRDQLVEELARLEQRVQQIRDLMIDHDIVISEQELQSAVNCL